MRSHDMTDDDAMMRALRERLDAVEETVPFNVGMSIVPLAELSVPAVRLHYVEALLAGVLHEDGTRGPPLITWEQAKAFLDMPERADTVCTRAAPLVSCQPTWKRCGL